MSDLELSYSDIAKAHERIKGVVHRTPILTSSTADQMTGARLFFKCENFQRAGSFKFRGAYNALAQFSKEQLKNGVIAYSSGNHAQAIALSAKILKTKAVIVMPSDAPKVKIDATRGYGAEIVTYNRLTESRELIGQRLAKERNLTLIPPFDHLHTIAGQGTLALEFFEDVPNIDILVTPLGGGGMLSGCAVVAKQMNPNCKVFGVEPEAGNDGQQSFRSGKIVQIKLPDTIADGAQTLSVGQHTFPIMQKLATDIVTVTDKELINAMKFLASRMKIIVEPTGCLPAAAVFNSKIDISGMRVGIVLSGGNIDLSKFAALTSGDTNA